MNRLAAAAMLAFTVSISNGCSGPESVEQKEEAVDRIGKLRTLYSYDALMHSYSFTLDESGLTVLGGEHGGQIFNRNTQIVFDRYERGSLVVGVEGHSKAFISDLGDLRTSDQLESALSYLTRKGNVLTCDVAIAKRGTPLAFRLDGPRQPQASAVPRIGHVYIIRIDEPTAGGNEGDPIETTHVALRIVSHNPGISVTFRWRRL